MVEASHDLVDLVLLEWRSIEMYSGRNPLWSVWLIVVLRLALGKSLDVEIPNPPIMRVRDKSVKTFPVNVETSFVEFGVNHNFAISQMNDRLKIVRHFVLSNKNSGCTKNAEDLAKSPLLLFKGERYEGLHGFL